MKLNEDIAVSHPLRNQYQEELLCLPSEQRPQVALLQILWWDDPEHSWQVQLMLAALGGHRQALTGTDSDSGLGSAKPMVDGNAQSFVKDPELKICH